MRVPEWVRTPSRTRKSGAYRGNYASMFLSSFIFTLLYSWQAFTTFKGCACCAKHVQGYTAELSEALIFSMNAPQQHCLLTLYQHTSSYFATH